MEQIQELPNEFSDFDIPFKISAGPGAGKTTWLVKHVQNVIQNSDRLGRIKKVACITYTRIGADTVSKKIKIETGTNRLDIGTIHSFLYRNVIKPFSFLIEHDLNGSSLFNINELSGVIENRLNHGRFSSWKLDRRAERKFYMFDEKLKDDSNKTNLEKTIFCLNKIDWKLVNGEISIGLTIKYRPKLLMNIKGQIEETTVSNAHLIDYKKKYWKHGIMHHEDVLYFAHYIFKNYPKVIKLTSSKFPYIFLDEFQDTNPLQTWIVKQLASKGTTVGVIGDPAQSIFEFAGAKRKDFNDFLLQDLKHYKKSDNFRSTIKIIDFIKTLRNDIEQKPPNDAQEGKQVTILVGTAETSIDYVKNLGDANFAVLCRYNKDVNRLRYNIRNTQGDNLISALYSEDSDHTRPRFIHSLLKAYDFYEKEEYKEAIKEIKKHLRGTSIEGFAKRKLSIKIIRHLIANKNLTIVDLFNYYQDDLKSIQKKMKRINKSGGVYKDIYLKSFKDFLPFLSKQTKIQSKIRTIHQAKGDEFNNLLLCLFNKKDKNERITKRLENIINDYIFNASTNIKLDNSIGEETRLVYVACSRAKKKLFINTPSLSEEFKTRFKQLGCNIIEITSNTPDISEF